MVTEGTLVDSSDPLGAIDTTLVPEIGKEIKEIPKSTTINIVLQPRAIGGSSQHVSQKGRKGEQGEQQEGRRTAQ